MFLLKRLLTLLLLISVTGCSYVSKPSFIQYRDKHYLTATTIPPLKTPPGISSQAFQNLYPVSDRGYAVNTKEMSIEPPGL